MHLELARAYADMLRARGWTVIFPPQRGRASAADMIAFKRAEDGWKRIAVEVEVSADHAEQVRRNYEKNIRKGVEVVFVVPDERVAERVRRILGKENYKAKIITLGL